MTNTIFGLLSLLFVVTIISLWVGCNRNNTKTETNITNTTTDTLNITNDSLSTSMVKEIPKTPNDSLKANIHVDSNSLEIMEVAKNEEPSLKENSIIAEAGEKEFANKETNTPAENKTANNFKENINQPKAKGKGGPKAVGNINEVLSDNKPKGRVIIVGSGGGVTGAVTSYKIFEDGSLFESNLISTNETQKKLKVLKDAKAIQNQFEALNIDTMKLNAPGNIYFFVGYEENGKTHRCTWGANDEPAPENLKTFYENLMNTISKNQ